MPRYTFWYRKEIESKDIVSAIKQVEKVPPTFDHVKEVIPEEKEALIGFEIEE